MTHSAQTLIMSLRQFLYESNGVDPNLVRKRPLGYYYYYHYDVGMLILLSYT